MAWNKWRLGWLDAKQIRGLTSPGTVETTISPVETAGGLKLIVAQTSPTLPVRGRGAPPLGQRREERVRRRRARLHGRLHEEKRRSARSSSTPAQTGNGPDHAISTLRAKYEAPFDVGPGEVSTFENADVKVEVLSTDGVNYRVRVTRK